MLVPVVHPQLVVVVGQLVAQLAQLVVVVGQLTAQLVVVVGQLVAQLVVVVGQLLAQLVVVLHVVALPVVAFAGQPLLVVLLVVLVYAGVEALVVFIVVVLYVWAEITVIPKSENVTIIANKAIVTFFISDLLFSVLVPPTSKLFFLTICFPCACSRKTTKRS